MLAYNFMPLFNSSLDCHNRIIIAAQNLSITSGCRWIGPRYTYSSTYNGVGPFVDFYFVCRVNYDRTAVSPTGDDDEQMFEVLLTYNSRISSVNKTTSASTSLDVVFTSQDMSDGFGTKVCLSSPRGRKSGSFSNPATFRGLRYRTNVYLLYVLQQQQN